MTFYGKVQIAWFCVAMLGTTSIEAQDAATQYIIVGIKAGDTLNVRSGPGMKYPIAARLTNNTSDIQVQGAPVMNGNDDWVHIAFPNGGGWTRPKYLMRSDELVAAMLGAAISKDASVESKASTSASLKLESGVSNKSEFQRAVMRDDLSMVAHYARPEYIDEPFVGNPGSPDDNVAFPPVFHACVRGYTDLVVFLGDHGANMKCQYKSATPALVAEKMGHHETAEAVVRYGGESVHSTMQKHMEADLGAAFGIAGLLFGAAEHGNSGPSDTSRDGGRDAWMQQKQENQEAAAQGNELPHPWGPK